MSIIHLYLLYYFYGKYTYFLYFYVFYSIFSSYTNYCCIQVDHYHHLTILSVYKLENTFNVYPHIILHSYGECVFLLVLFLFFCLILTTVACRLIIMLPPHCSVCIWGGECVQCMSTSQEYVKHISQLSASFQM